LVANALEAMGTGDRLTLRAGWSDSGDLVLPARRWADSRRVKVEVEDTGTGIPSSDTDKVFTPFFTTKPGGTGLGLALAHKIIEDHGGSISFRSSPGVGTTFRVLLPLTPDPHAGTGGDDDHPH
ncbi:MAG: histidine kinase, partial [Candidatus Rokubacteria bacterium]|nr:histidine kinase [Candidatus Rokubacteria bacterium]